MNNSTIETASSRVYKITLEILRKRYQLPASDWRLQTLIGERRHIAGGVAEWVAGFSCPAQLKDVDWETTVPVYRQEPKNNWHHFLIAVGLRRFAKFENVVATLSLTIKIPYACLRPEFPFSDHLDQYGSIVVPYFEPTFKGDGPFYERT